MINSIITGTGAILPDRVVDNSHFSTHQFFGKDGNPVLKPATEVIAKLEEISSIKSRRYILDDEDNVPMMKAAGEKAVANAGIDRDQIDGIIVAHNTGNMRTDGSGWDPVPNLGSLIKNALQIKNHNCFAYDILFGCPGWVQGMIQAHHAIQMGDANHVLIVGVEVVSRVLDPHDVDSMLLGDGCGAVILSRSEGDTPKGVLSNYTFSHCQEDYRSIYINNSNNPEASGKPYFKMNGRDVYRYATTWVPQVIQKAMAKSNTSIHDVDLFLFHQANGKMLDVIVNNIAKLFNVDMASLANKIPRIIEFTGNTSVASIPTMLDKIHDRELGDFEIKDGQLMVMASVGAGMHCNALVYQN